MISSLAVSWKLQNVSRHLSDARPQLYRYARLVETAPKGAQVAICQLLL